MAEVLSQSQIDALLNSMVSGGEDAVETVQKEEQAYRYYDFNSPKKVYQGQIKAAEGNL